MLLLCNNNNNNILHSTKTLFVVVLLSATHGRSRSRSFAQVCTPRAAFATSDMAALSLASLLLAEAGPAAAALLPLSEQMLWQHFGDAVPPANSGYGRQRRRRMEALTPENTQRIRLKVDYTSLYPDTAAKYSACFNVGDWYARGLPGPDPPADGVATCRGDTSDKDCWGKCAEIDLITEIGRSMMIAVVDRVINEVEGLFALIPSQEPLTFDKSPGRYAGAYLDNGYASEDKCARDCTMLSGVAVNDDYCDTGFYTDAVVSLVKPATIPGVAGTGGACASDSTGRPTWLVFSWIQSINEATASGSNMAKRNGEDDETAVRRLVEEYRGLVIHELLHALGFTNAKFRAARDAAGNRKDLITLKPVTDLDGTKDEVWFFTKGRAYELAQDYFGCYDNSTWDGLPLMGLPELGRATHWETRIMRDDVMTYGRTLEAVSSITLASMEDLGFYLANYSAAECISWGYKQGCNYVATRCGAGIDDQSQTDVAKNDCKGNPNWGLAWNTYLTEKCAGGTTPCEQGSGWSDSGRKCNAQCYTGPNRAGCKTAPTSKLEGAGSGGISDYVPNVNWEQFLFLASWVLGGLTFFGVLRNFICPKKGSAKVLCATSTFFVLAGAAFHPCRPPCPTNSAVSAPDPQALRRSSSMCWCWPGSRRSRSWTYLGRRSRPSSASTSWRASCRSASSSSSSVWLRSSASAGPRSTRCCSSGSSGSSCSCCRSPWPSSSVGGSSPSRTCLTRRLPRCKAPQTVGMRGNSAPKPLSRWRASYASSTRNAAATLCSIWCRSGRGPRSRPAAATRRSTTPCRTTARAYTRMRARRPTSRSRSKTRARPNSALTSLAPTTGSRRRPESATLSTSSSHSNCAARTFASLGCVNASRSPPRLGWLTRACHDPARHRRRDITSSSWS